MAKLQQFALKHEPDRVCGGCGYVMQAVIGWWYPYHRNPKKRSVKAKEHKPYAKLLSYRCACGAKRLDPQEKNHFLEL